MISRMASAWVVSVRARRPSCWMKLRMAWVRGCSMAGSVVRLMMGASAIVLIWSGVGPPS